MAQVTRQQYEVQLRQIFRMMLENKTQEEIAHELHINVRTVQRYYQRIEKRYGEMQRQKTDNTIFLECQLFKNRMLKLYKILEEKATSSSSPNNNNTTNGHEIAKCCEVAADIAINVLKMESEGIKAVIKELVGAEREAASRSSPSANSDSNMMEDDDLEESFDDYYPCIKEEEYNLFHVHNWIQFFVSMYNDTIANNNNYFC